MDLTRLLSEDVLADVLRRVAPRDLAVCRCACKALRAVVDASGLLRTDLLPLAVGGIFINFRATLLSEFFARPSTGPTISGRFDYLPRPDDYLESLDCCSIVDHCNGLLLLDAYKGHYYVVNPATQQWYPLPTRPSMFKDADPDFAYQQYLAFDPTLSPHYQVFLIPHPRYKRKSVEDEVDRAMEESEWPPSMCALHVFSSRSGCWEERSFIRQGKAAGTIADMRSSDLDERRYAVYHGGTLYVHCKTDFIMRIYLTNDTYQVIKAPTDGELIECREFRLGRSEKGVYLASICRFGWFAYTSNTYRLQDINCNVYLKEYMESNEPPDEHVEQLLDKKIKLINSIKKTLVEAKVEWDSDNDDILDNEYMGTKSHQNNILQPIPA
ncbi:uncharacterized protein LOC123425091 [Hordeum vulgare subsp. vulgare]|uniref:uncharacterized protein LOC123425091 n=1 Tax=Hordeum vulgare subsp. vulgare TaxID=112509 RepID=UPI001D1A3EEB|nr:uncharacterized protein LOC123425091 [Hordeum vulgare subsp. vulgare]